MLVPECFQKLPCLPDDRCHKPGGVWTCGSMSEVTPGAQQSSVNVVHLARNM